MSSKFKPATDIPSLAGKVILVTGGNAGLGKQTIKYLAQHSPARIYLAARTASKAEAAIEDIKREVPNACPIEHLPLDLTSFASIATAADTLKSKERRLDILINNAGVMALPYSLTKEGYEIQFGTNHMGHALFTKLLMPVLLETAKTPDADVRIVNLSSIGHYGAPSAGVIFEQPALEQHSTWRRYGQSKLANILFTKELATRYPEITSIAVHPGAIITDLYAGVRTNFIMNIGLWIYSLFTPILPGHFKDPTGGALTQTWGASTAKENLKNGAYYVPIGKLAQGSAKARDDGLAKKLWEYTETEFAKHGY
ncbi:oxidoreductase-like protein [Aaosphaeria arxii CBS 175.79]|uniref:Oxidoreductase-like protein n=1 Tax=Aaosphaeria arxii CBS 175.79 TaxID=1450172 RepID=A0A6A5XYV6_9PLEO|nr:oxidoreductase-like protein [Aaosphaeria arxii CBS 175.79]KAF2017464.1 oxidoreductase-like protein [Aaosphaeria arxii CBS 175.79]